jgi:hypothetical protein
VAKEAAVYVLHMTKAINFGTATIRGQALIEGWTVLECVLARMSWDTGASRTHQL